MKVKDLFADISKKTSEFAKTSKSGLEEFNTKVKKKVSKNDKKLRKATKNLGYKPPKLEL